MPWWGIVLIVLGAVAVLMLLTAFACFYMACHSRSRRPIGEEEYPMPPGKIYEPFYPQFEQWMRELRALPHEEIAIKSYDGLTLRGQYYECRKGAPIELLIPGYRGTAERDLCGGVQRCFELGHNALIVDQRSGGLSEGHTITFGIKERYDCQTWARYLAERFGEEVPIILTGISMGAATVMMTAALDLPSSVVGVLADCGYTSPKAIIKKVIRQIGLPANVFYPFVRFGARLFGGFDLEAASPAEAMKTCRLPVVFIHGDADDYVPCAMSRENYEACTAPKQLMIVAGAGHGLAYPVDPKGYMAILRKAFGDVSVSVGNR